MNRTILATAFVAAIFAVVALVFVWYVSFGMARPADGTVRSALTEKPVRLSYREDGSVSIAASSELDAYRALGYQAGRDHSWTIALLRQTASGRLGEWFGPPVFKLDEFAHQLGFASTARAAADRLNRNDARTLAAYAEGVSEALRDKNVSMGNEFVLFDIRPEPWEAWQSLAIERMIAWLSEPPITAAATDSLFWAIRSLEDDDRRFRSWLHLHGADMSAAWSWNDPTGSHFAARFVYGATALPLFSAVSMKWPQTSFTGITLLGTPIFPVISGPSGVSVTTFSSDRRIETITINRGDNLVRNRHERIVGFEGDETLLTVPTYGNRILIDGAGARVASDSIFHAVGLAWSGLGSVSDWPMWHRNAKRLGSNQFDEIDPESFRLFDGDGIMFISGGSSITGTPTVQLSSGDRLFVSNNNAVAHAGRRLAVDEIDLGHLVGEDISEWARDNVPRALSQVESASGFSDRVNEAIEYLRNWDYRYNGASIGASIFDGWMVQYRDHRGTYPEIEIPSDSLELALTQLALHRSLFAAVDSLALQAGPDLARWRLEHFRTGKRFFPVWSYPPLEEALPGLIRSRYQAIEIPQDGHPTTLIWQPGLDDEPANSPSYVFVTGRVGAPGSLSVRPDYEIGSGFIARYVVAAPDARGQNANRIIEEVVLTPPN